MRIAATSFLITFVALAIPTRDTFAQSTCQEWTPGLFPVEGVSSTVYSPVPLYALLVCDDGRGTALFAGGDFNVAGGALVNGVARWDGHAWSPLGSGVDDSMSVFALGSFDDGSGPGLYVGGEFRDIGGERRRHIARWNGSSWSSLGYGVDGAVHALADFDDGSGRALYVGGEFIDASGVTAYRIARWRGGSWSPVGIGVNDVVRCFAEYDDGSGTSLYAGGDFTTADGRLVNSIARWDGNTWLPVGGGFDTAGVRALVVFDDGSGAALYAAGRFAAAGGGAASHIARWNGAQWAPVGGGIEGDVHALSVFRSGGAPVLVAGGPFATVGGATANGVAQWDGSTWSPMGTGFGSEFGGGAIVRALASFDDGAGRSLFAGGDFSAAEGLVAHDMARWNGAAWSRVGGGITGGVGALQAFDDGSGLALWVGGRFDDAGDVAAHNVARFDGRSFHSVAGGLNAPVVDFEVFDDGTSRTLYAATDYHVVRWNGSGWTTIGSTTGYFRKLAAFDDGTGPALYATGIFSSVSGTPAHNYAKWNGSAWSALGIGQFDPLDVEVFDDGTGPALYGCGFSHQIVRWNGSAWSYLPSVTQRIFALASYDDGSGLALYAGGNFVYAGGRLVNRVGRWNGTEWSALSGGVNGDVYMLAVADDGTGPALYAGGYFGQADGRPALGIAKWNGTWWSALGSGVVQNSVADVGDFDDGNGRAAYIGGRFDRAGDVVSGRVARWGATPPMRGSVNALTGPVADVLFANDSAGDANRAVRVGVGAPITIRLTAAPLGPARTTYVLWAWLGSPTNPSELALDGSSIGCFGNPTPFHRHATPQPFLCMHGAGVPAIACAGARIRRGPPDVPWTATIASGFSSPITVTLQGAMQDAGAGNTSRISATNAVLLEVQ
ncbi:MAG: hypothetical protein HYR85_22140 [Planctomycetes bacterium]|nr:hypothetical protein [Planctomycetota bacterium]MBI3848659.1 hypothetical protein [Planctomycetota bacterium]